MHVCVHTNVIVKVICAINLIALFVVVIVFRNHVLLEIPLTLAFTDNFKNNKFCSAKIIIIQWHIIYFEGKTFFKQVVK